jgi:hypothetical protein
MLHHFYKKKGEEVEGRKNGGLKMAARNTKKRKIKKKT